MRFTLGILMFAQAFAQESPDAAALLARQADELQRYHSYQYTQDMTMEMKMPGMSVPGMSMPGMLTTTVIQAVNPGKTRMETKSAGIDMLMITNGDQSWTYMPMLKQYTKTSEDSLKDFGTTFVAAGDQMTANAKVTGSEVLEVDAQQHDCWVVESKTDKIAMAAQAAGPATEMQDVVYTAWIDKTLGLQMKTSLAGKMKTGAAMPAMQMRITMTLHSLKFNEDLPDSLFVFTPPADAKESDNLFAGMQTALGATGAKPPEAAPAAAKQPVKPPAPGEPEAYVPDLEPTHRVQPDSPPEAKGKGILGFVHVLLTVDAGGSVVAAEPLSGPEVLRAAALDAVKQWRFLPVIRNGHAVVTYTDEMVDFSPEWEVEKKLEELSQRSGDTVPDDAPGVGFDPARILSAAKADDLDIDVAGEMKAGERIQELEARFPRSPEQVLADTEDQKRGLSGEERYLALPDLAKKALAAGDFGRASSYATELLQLAPENKSDSGDAVYTGNSVLGLVALRQGSVSQARQYLLEAGKATGSPVLASFGPDFTLARELLDKGERDAVLEFLTECKGFWKSGAEQLDSMIKTVKTGGTF